MARVKILNVISREWLASLYKEHEVGEDILDPEAIIVRSANIDIGKHPSLVAIARAGAGVNNINIAEATQKGICIFNTPGANANAVKELVFIMLGLYARRVDAALIFARSLAGNDDAAIAAKVESEKSQFTGFELAGKTLGVIGLGKIGVLVANAGIERGMAVVGYDAFPILTNMHQLNPKAELAKRLDDVLVRAEILSVHVPLNEKTKSLIGRMQIELLRHGCVLMNFARGGIYDDTAVLTAIQAGKVAAYITDFPTHALLESDKVICTPHLGASTAESAENCAAMAVGQLQNYLGYGVVVNSVNFPTVEAFPHPATTTRLAIVNQDIPNMIASITGVLGLAGINIQALTNESNGTIGYTLVDLERDIPQDVANTVRRLRGILRVRVLQFSK